MLTLLILPISVLLRFWDIAHFTLYLRVITEVLYYISGIVKENKLLCGL